MIAGLAGALGGVYGFFITLLLYVTLSGFNGYTEKEYDQLGRLQWLDLGLVGGGSLIGVVGAALLISGRNQRLGAIVALSAGVAVAVGIGVIAFQWGILHASDNIWRISVPVPLALWLASVLAWESRLR